MRIESMSSSAAAGAAILAAVLGSAACSGSTTRPSDAAAMDGRIEAQGSGGARGDGASPEDVAREADGAFDGPAEGPSDAAGEASGSGACLGDCFEALTSACPMVTGCVTATAGAQTVICYANGVKELKQVDGANVDGTVKRANGDLCYHFTLTGTDETFMDPAGQTVAKLNGGATATLYTAICEPGDVMRSVDLSTPACSSTLAVAAQTCAAGACAWE